MRASNLHPLCYIGPRQMNVCSVTACPVGSSTGRAGLALEHRFKRRCSFRTPHVGLRALRVTPDPKDTGPELQISPRQPHSNGRDRPALHRPKGGRGPAIHVWKGALLFFVDLFLSSRSCKSCQKPHSGATARSPAVRLRYTPQAATHGTRRACVPAAHVWNLSPTPTRTHIDRASP